MIQAMKAIKLESGILPILRILVGYWMGYWLTISPILQVTTGQTGTLALEQYAALIATQGVAMILLLWPAAQQRLDRAFLPVVITLCTFSFFVEKQWFLTAGLGPDASRSELLHAYAMRQDFALLLAIVAWQYRWREAVLYTFIISGIEWWLISSADRPDHLVSAISSNDLIKRAIIYLLLGYLITWLMQQQRSQRQALVEANRQQAETNAKLAHYATTIEQLSTSRERNRLARELHDTLAHSLSALSVQLEAVRSLWEVNPQAAWQMLEQADETTRTGLTEARRSLQSLRATPLEEFGLAFALRDMAETVARRADLRLDLEIAELAINLPPGFEQGIYRIAQEALENIVRHARAKHVCVKLVNDAHTVRLVIADDGIGFEPDEPNTLSNHFGLRGMRERAGMLNGNLQIISQPQQGVQICLTLALEGQ
ncbi:MAG: sensor histidine kinase [Anaerolineae bacterium]|nr:sensor histidine kinase [Anaerolineae bacterium]